MGKKKVSSVAANRAFGPALNGYATSSYLENLLLKEYCTNLTEAKCLILYSTGHQEILKHSMVQFGCWQVVCFLFVQPVKKIIIIFSTTNAIQLFSCYTFLSIFLSHMSLIVHPAPLITNEPTSIIPRM